MTRDDLEADIRARLSEYSLLELVRLDGAMVLIEYSRDQKSAPYDLTSVLAGLARADRQQVRRTWANTAIDYPSAHELDEGGA